MLTPVLALL